MFTFVTLVLISVTLAVAAAFVWLVPSRTEQRLHGIAPGIYERQNWSETVLKMVGPFAKLSVPKGEWESSPLRLRFLNAGIRHENARLAYFGAKTILPLFLSAVAFFGMRTTSQGMALLFYVSVAALIGCYLPNVLLHFKAKSRQREIFENFPDATDLMLVCVEAGLGLDAGLTKVTDELRRKSVALAEELHLTNLEMRAGATREKSLRNLALRTGVEEIGTFATMLTQADKFGTSIGDSLRVFSDDLRHKRQVRAEETAAKIPTKMLFPLVFFIFPSVIMVVLGPAIIQIVRTMIPLLTGTGK
jgi:tight adherence protein C